MLGAIGAILAILKPTPTSSPSATGSGSPFPPDARRSASSLKEPSKYPRLYAIVRSQMFETLIALIIVGNCVTMGIEAEVTIGKPGAKKLQSFVQFSEHFFTAVFLAEFLLRLVVCGYEHYLPQKEVLNFLDAMLVLVSGVFVVWILPFFAMKNSSALRTLTTLRALRLVRLVHVVSKVNAFHEVWLLLRGLTDSMKTLVWTMVVIAWVTYLFAVFGVVLISSRLKKEYDSMDANTEDFLELDSIIEFTDGIVAMMYTLIQVLTLDSWNAFARIIMKYLPWSWMFWYLYVSIVVIVLMNLVTAVIVENALSQSQKDVQHLLAQKEAERKKELQQFTALFRMIDSDNDGQLTWTEFEESFEEPEVSLKLRLLGFEKEDCKEIFMLLDSGDGNLSLEEFFEGLTRMEGNAQARDMFKAMKNAEVLGKLLNVHAAEVSEELDDLLEHTTGCRAKKRPENLKFRSCTKALRDIGLPTSPTLHTNPRANGNWNTSMQADGQLTCTAEMAEKSQEVKSAAATPLSAAQAEDTDFCDVLNSVNEVSEKLNAAQAQLGRRVQDCNERVAGLYREVGELRGVMSQVLQRLPPTPWEQSEGAGVAPGRAREVNACCTTFLR